MRTRQVTPARTERGVTKDCYRRLASRRATRGHAAFLLAIGGLIAGASPALWAGTPPPLGRYGQVRQARQPAEEGQNADGSSAAGSSRQGGFRGSGAATVVDYEAFQRLADRLEAAEAEIESLRQNSVAPNGSQDLPAPAVPPAPDAVLPGPKPLCEECLNCETDEEEPIKLPYLTPFSAGEGYCYCAPGGDITFKPGFRTQPRYFYDDSTNNNDFFIRRFRLKLGGDAFGIAKYYGEIKFDGTGAFETQAAGVVENAWLEFPLLTDLSYLRVGLYDIPISRNALTSDSKLLFMDRTLIKSELTDKGLADNTVGLLVHGRPLGRVEYSVGVFDNVVFEAFDPEDPENSQELMTAGRVALHLLDPETSLDGYADYRESYIGEGQRLSVGANSAYLGEAIDVTEFELYVLGIDLFFNSGPWVFQAEYDWFAEAFGGERSDMTGEGWYVQGGYLLGCIHEAAIEVAARHQELRPDDFEEDKLRWTSVGMNVYIRDHNLKVQTDYTFKQEDSDIDNDTFKVQLQLDY